MEEEEDTRLFLSILDAATESAFEACSKIRAEESSNDYSNRIGEHNIILKEEKKLYPDLIHMNVSSILSEAQEGRKRRRIRDQHISQQPYSDRNIHLGTNEEPFSVDWPENFSFQFSKGLEPKESSSQVKAKNFLVLRKESVSGSGRKLSGAGLVRFWEDSSLSKAMLPRARNDATSETEDEEKIYDFSKEFHEAITRIESLIPSLQRLASCADMPNDQQNIGNLSLYNSSTRYSGPANSLQTAKREISGNEQGHHSGKCAELSENVLIKQDDQLLGKGKVRMPLPVNQNTRVKQTHGGRGVDMPPPNGLLALDDGEVKAESIMNQSVSRVSGELELEKRLRTNRNQALEPECKAPMDRIESLKHTSSRNDKNRIRMDMPVYRLSALKDGRIKAENIMKYPQSTNLSQFELARSSDAESRQAPESKFPSPMERHKSVKRTSSRNNLVATHNLGQMQGLGTMPCQYCKDKWKQSEAIGKEDTSDDATSTHWTSVPSVGSASYRRLDRTSNRGNSYSKHTLSHARGGVSSQMMIDSTRKNRVTRKNIKEAVHRKNMPHNLISEETSWNSPASSSSVSAESSSYPSSLSGDYQSNDSYNQSDESESTADYYSSSYYSSQDQSSDAGLLRRSSLIQTHKWKHRLDKRKEPGGFSRLRKKLDMIFHHHHHHHHYHQSDRNEYEVGQAGFWKRLGKMFGRRGKSDNHKQKVEKPGKPVVKSVVKKKPHGGNFHALVGGLMRHMKRSKKTNQVNDGFGELGSPGRGRKRAKKLPWWPKIPRGKGGVKRIPRLGRKKRPPLAAAKMILRQ